MFRVMIALAVALAAPSSIAVTAASAQSQADEPILVGTLGGVFSTLWAVNNDGDAVGWSDVTYTDSEHAILWRDGQLIDLGTLPGDTVSRALGINNLGQIVGLSVNTHGGGPDVRAVLWDHGQVIEIPGGAGNSATAINDKGDIAVGGWLLRDGQRVPIGLLPGYTSATVAAINDSGVAVGSMFDGMGGSTAFRWEKGVLTDLGALAGATNSTATAINARGQVAGTVQRAGSPVVAEPVLWEGSTVSPLAGSWGVFQGVARGINNRGDVVGLGSFLDGSGDGTFVWSRGRFRFHSPYFLALDINEPGTAVGRYSEDGWTAQGALLPKAGTRAPAAVPDGR